MIKLQDLTPDVYYNQSRDFQFLGRLFDLVLNATKTNADLIYSVPFSYNSPEQLIDLMSLTLGFKSRHNYNIKQLTSLCSAFVEIIRNKGNRQALDLAIQALLHAEGITATFKLEPDKDDPYTLNLYVPDELSDINLLRDLLTYILPAGMSCNIIKEFIIEKNITTELGTSDEFEILKPADGDFYDGDELSQIPQLLNADITNASVGHTAGILPNSTIFHPALPEDTEEETE